MLLKLYYFWRVFATGFAILVFGLGGLLLSFIVFPVFVFTSSKPDIRQARAQYLIYNLFQFYVGLLGFLGLIKLSVTGHERLLACQGQLIVANHPSLLDVVILMSLLPKTQCIVKSELWENRFIGGVVRAANYIRNDGGPEDIMKQCSQMLQEGQNIILFPEGTRTKPKKAVKFKRGAASIALEAKADIQLVKINLSPTTLTKGAPWYQVAKTRVNIRVSVEACLDISPYLLQGTRSIAARDLTRKLEQYYIGI